MQDTTMLAPPDPAEIGEDPNCQDTPADRNTGGLGQLAAFLRRLFARYLPWWVYPPPGFRSFDVQAAIATPAVGTSATVVSLLVPIGFACVVRALSVNIIGPGFTQGGGALVFAVRVDGAPVKGYGIILTELGTPQFQRPSNGILAESNQLIEIVASNIAYVAGGTNMVASLSGYHCRPPERGRGGQ